jgi:hypothetical protein
VIGLTPSICSSGRYPDIPRETSFATIRVRSSGFPYSVTLCMFACSSAITSRSHSIDQNRIDEIIDRSSHALKNESVDWTM